VQHALPLPALCIITLYRRYTTYYTLFSLAILSYESIKRAFCIPLHSL
jgi:hypothetical protein